MRPPKPLTLIALTLLLVQTVGCTSFRPLTEPLPTEPRPTGSEKKSVIRVETQDGNRMELFSGWMDSENVGGVRPSRRDEPLVIPLSQVRTVEVAEFDGKKTILFVGVATAVAVYLAAAYIGGTVMSEALQGLSGGSR